MGKEKSNNQDKQTLKEWLATFPEPTQEQLTKLNRFGDPIAEYGDWTDSMEWLPPPHLDKNGNLIQKQESQDSSTTEQKTNSQSST